MRDDAAPASSELPIPAALNVAIGALAVSAALACLWTASHASHWALVAAAAMAFAAANNTVFCLLHECVHYGFHPSRGVNDGAGVLFAALFPTALGIQRVSHFGHHRRNRTDLELYDYYLPHQSRWLKSYWIYCLLTGFYWAIIPVAVLVYLVFPFAFKSRWFQAGPARFWGFEPFVRDIAAEPIAQVWPQALFTACAQLSIWRLLGLSLPGGLACYWAFGIAWSTLQYTDHAWSPRDVTEGAWNLRRVAARPAHPLELQLPPRPSPPARHPLDPPAALRPARGPATVLRVDLLAHVAWRRARPGRRRSRAPSARALRAGRVAPMTPRPPSWPTLGRLTAGVSGALFVALVFFPVYLGSATLTASRASHWRPYLQWELGIPFVPFMVVPYLSMFLLFLLPPFQLDEEELLALAARLAVLSLLGGMVFLAFPARLGFAPRSDAGIWQSIYSGIYRIDGPFNTVPSFHVIYTTSILLAMAEVATPTWRRVYLAWLVVVPASAVLTHRHHLLDVATGLALALAAPSLVPLGRRLTSLPARRLQE